MQKINVIALANTVAIIDILLHPFFHFWIKISPNSYEWVMNLYVAGLQLKITSLDTSLYYIILGTVVEAATLWLLALTFGLLYNKLNKQ